MLRRDHDLLHRALHDYPLTVAYLVLALWVTVIITILEVRF